MKIIVQKFGGTSVSTIERREQVVAKILLAIKKGYSPVVIVSAMGRKGEPYATDTLLSLIDNDFKKNNLQAVDMLMNCGEIISSIIMSNLLINKGIDSIPLTGGQAGIITNEDFTNAEVLYTNPKKITEALECGKVPIIAGFQGVSENNTFTTLGRGGSDTSACIIGEALKAEEIEIYTDVDGIMTADPRIVKDAVLINNISYNEVFQLAHEGAKVIHPKAVDYAKKANIPILIKNTMSECNGTLINDIGNKNNKKIISGITNLNNRVQIKVSLKENINNIKYRELLNILAQNKISLDLINIFPKEQIFTVDDTNKENVKEVLDKSNLKYSIIEDCSTIAIIGNKMNGVPGIMAKIQNILNENSIEILQTADSNMTIWCLIETKNINKALNLLHNEFKLNE